MISDERMLNAATTMMIDRMMNIITRSILIVWNSDEFCCFESWITPTL